MNESGGYQGTININSSDIYSCRNSAIYSYGNKEAFTLTTTPYQSISRFNYTCVSHEKARFVYACDECIQQQISILEDKLDVATKACARLQSARDMTPKRKFRFMAYDLVATGGAAICSIGWLSVGQYGFATLLFLAILTYFGVRILMEKEKSNK